MAPETSTCRHCGRRPSARSSAYCSSGCGLASRLPQGEQGLPASWQLGVALALFFLLFNQWLFWAMTSLSLHRGETLLATRFTYASLGSGAVVLATSVALWALARPIRWSDGLFASLAAVALIGVWIYRWAEGSQFSLLAFSVLNTLIAGWLARGLTRRAVSKKGENR